MFRPLQAFALITVVVATPVFAQDDAATQEPSSEVRLSPRERWSRLDPEQQERMRGRFERWQNLSDDERDAYQRRADEMKRAQRGALRQLRPEDRERFEQLDDATKEAVMKEMVHLQLVERTQRLRGKLPPEARKQLESAKPEDRTHILERLRHDRLRHAGERALEDLARRLGLTDKEINEIRGLAPKERHEELLALKRRAVESGVLDGVGPDGMGDHDWKRMRDLPPRDFAREWFRHHDHTERNPEDHKRRRIQEMIKPTLDELIEVSRAPEKERRVLLTHLIRVRIEAFGAEAGGLPAKLLDETKGLNDHEFIRRVRRHARPPEASNPRHPGQDGSPRPHEQRPGRAGQPHRPGPPGGADRPGSTDRPGARRDRDGKPGRATDSPQRQ